jgi:SAM-dependent methyltransferase
MPSLEWNRRWGAAFAPFKARHPDRTYGIQWGDPELRGWRYMLHALFHRGSSPGPLYKVVDRYIRPYVAAGATVLEIGCGGGRWTRYLVNAGRLIAVDIDPVFFAPLRARFPQAKLEFYQSSGFELTGIADDSVDYVFSFGTFVHIEPDGIAAYFAELKRVLRAGGKAVIQYAAKEKRAGYKEKTFSSMTAARMEAMAPMPILIHDRWLLNHSNIVVMEKPQDVASRFSGLC